MYDWCTGSKAFILKNHRDLTVKTDIFLFLLSETSLYIKKIVKKKILNSNMFNFFLSSKMEKTYFDLNNIIQLV